MLKLQLQMECFRFLQCLMDCQILNYQSKIKWSVLEVDQEIPMQLIPITFFCFKRRTTSLKNWLQQRLIFQVLFAVKPFITAKILM